MALGSYCRVTQELLNSDWSMRIGPRKSKLSTFCARHFFERLWIACTKTFTAELMDVIGPEREENGKRKYDLDRSGMKKGQKIAYIGTWPRMHFLDLLGLYVF